MLVLVVLALLLQRLFVCRRFRRRAVREVLAALPRASQRCAAKPAWVVPHVVRLKALMPDAGCRRIAQTFNRRFAPRSVSVSNSYVADVLRRHAYEVAFVRRQIKHRVPRPVRTNLVWGVDLTGKQDMNGDVHSMLGIVDHGSRRLLSPLVCPRRTALALLGHLFLAMSRHGQPNAVRTDNDAVFKTRVFRWGLSLIGVRHQLTTPGCPWQNGRIERVFGTLKRELDQLRVASGNVLAHLLDEFSVWYNEVRPHQHLDGATPLEVWRGIDPFGDRPKEVRWVSFWDGRWWGIGCAGSGRRSSTVGRCCPRGRRRIVRMWRGFRREQGGEAESGSYAAELKKMPVSRQKKSPLDGWTGHRRKVLWPVGRDTCRS